MTAASRRRQFAHRRPGRWSRRQRWTIGLLAVAGVVVIGGAAIHLMARHRAPTTPISAQRALEIDQRAERVGGRAADASPTPSPGSLATTHSNRLWNYHAFTMGYGGMRRSYLVVSPMGPVNGSLPVLVELQGCCGEAFAEAHRSAFQIVASPPAVIVFPQASGAAHQQHWDAGACCGQAAADHVDDVGFISAVIRRVQRTIPHAAPGKVRLAGYSNGARMALRMACERPGLFSAVAVYAGVEALSCRHNRPPPLSVLESVGTKDGEIRLSSARKPIKHGNFTDPTVIQQVGFYLRADACSSPTTLTVAGAVTETTWSCPHGRRVALAVYKGQTHAWPQAHGATPSAQQILWDFLAA